jgi:hypothetical protein
MKRIQISAASLMLFALVSFVASAQSGLPRIVTLPTDDFVYEWGSNSTAEERRRNDFEFTGFQRGFRCDLKGRFRPASRMRDYYNLREFEQTLTASLYFIEDATQWLNQLFLSNDLDWALMDCYIPETVESEVETEEKLQKALERAERQRDRRRERETRDDE